MGNLRNLAAADARELNIKDYGMLVEFKGPESTGTTYNTDAITGEPLRAVQILSDYRKFDPVAGEEITITEPIVVMARASLERIPLPGEKWFLRFPLDPDSDITPENGEPYVLSNLRSPEGGRSLGLIRFYPTKAIQS